MPRRKKKTPGLLLAWNFEKPRVELIWVAPSGDIMRVTRQWLKPNTDEALADWMQDYRQRLEAGYRPEGFEEPPVPHCARVSIRRKVVAEWKRPMTIEELRRIDQRRTA